MTSYDTLWTYFINNCKTADINLPTTDEKIYDCIHTAIARYNVRMQESLTCDDANEELSESLTDTQLLLVANYLRWAFFKNQLTYYVTTWHPFQNDIGIRNYKVNVDGLTYMMNEAEKEINLLISESATDIV